MFSTQDTSAGDTSLHWYLKARTLSTSHLVLLYRVGDTKAQINRVTSPKSHSLGPKSGTLSS